ncbi:hypothetical protein T492DRAFT_886140 [Pavlovales sp. CCMP2436]|nr:hypothetical protein T492DRAFT_886140 [Pavlovales sp. CCMP2436]
MRGRAIAEHGRRGRAEEQPHVARGNLTHWDKDPGPSDEEEDKEPADAINVGGQLERVQASVSMRAGCVGVACVTESAQLKRRLLVIGCGEQGEARLPTTSGECVRADAAYHARAVLLTTGVSLIATCIAVYIDCVTLDGKPTHLVAYVVPQDEAVIDRGAWRPCDDKPPVPGEQAGHHGRCTTWAAQQVEFGQNAASLHLVPPGLRGVSQSYPHHLRQQLFNATHPRYDESVTLTPVFPPEQPAGPVVAGLHEVLKPSNLERARLWAHAEYDRHVHQQDHFPGPFGRVYDLRGAGPDQQLLAYIKHGVLLDADVGFASCMVPALLFLGENLHAAARDADKLVAEDSVTIMCGAQLLGVRIFGLDRLARLLLCWLLVAKRFRLHVADAAKRYSDRGFIAGFWWHTSLYGVYRRMISVLEYMALRINIITVLRRFRTGRVVFWVDNRAVVRAWNGKAHNRLMQAEQVAPAGEASRRTPAPDLWGVPPAVLRSFAPPPPEEPPLHGTPSRDRLAGLARCAAM